MVFLFLLLFFFASYIIAKMLQVQFHLNNTANPVSYMKFTFIKNLYI